MYIRLKEHGRTGWEGQEDSKSQRFRISAEEESVLQKRNQTQTKKINKGKRRQLREKMDLEEAGGTTIIKIHYMKLSKN